MSLWVTYAPVVVKNRSLSAAAERRSRRLGYKGLDKGRAERPTSATREYKLTPLRNRPTDVAVDYSRTLAGAPGGRRGVQETLDVSQTLTVEGR